MSETLPRFSAPTLRKTVLEMAYAADKVVKRKLVVMGYLTFQVDPKKLTIRNEFTRNGTHGVWKIAVQGDRMIGTLTKLPQNVVVRQITLRRTIK